MDTIETMTTTDDQQVCDLVVANNNDNSDEKSLVNVDTGKPKLKLRQRIFSIERINKFKQKVFVPFGVSMLILGFYLGSEFEHELVNEDLLPKIIVVFCLAVVTIIWFKPKNAHIKIPKFVSVWFQ